MKVPCVVILASALFLLPGLTFAVDDYCEADKYFIDPSGACDTKTDPKSGPFHWKTQACRGFNDKNKLYVSPNTDEEICVETDMSFNVTPPSTFTPWRPAANHTRAISTRRETLPNSASATRQRCACRSEIAAKRGPADTVIHLQNPSRNIWGGCCSKTLYRRHGHPPARAQ